MADRYFRLVCFVVNICPEPLRKLFLVLARADATTSYTTLDAYLTSKNTDINQLKSQGRIRKDQYDLLFPQPGHGTADESQWDVTLLVNLITGLFAPCLQPLDIFFMNKEIKGIRNELQHLPNTSDMTEQVFNGYWGRLETAAMGLAKQVFTTTEEDAFRNKIEDTKIKHLPDLGDCLRLWYEEIIKQMFNIIADMKTKLDKVESNSSETTALLRNVTIQKPGAAGKGNKRQRLMVADRTLAHLQASFETIMKELPDNFNAPAEVADIRTKLREKHHVVVAGSYKSRYFETALAAITGMDYNYKRCVEMQKSSDWRHIDPVDVDFVLCRDPFGSNTYDENKAKCMADIFNSMMHTTNGDNENTLDIMMVTDFKILTECEQSHGHDMLEELVTVFGTATKENPADLTHVCDPRYNFNSTSSLSMHNLRATSGQSSSSGSRNTQSLLLPSDAGVDHPHVWSIASKQTYNIKVEGEEYCDIWGCCQLPSGEFLLTDYNNKRLKKIDVRFQVIAVCDVHAWLRYVCYIGNNMAVVSTYSNELLFIDADSMRLNKTIKTEHECRRVTCHGNKLYVTSIDSVYVYSTDGIALSVLYTNLSFNSMHHIAVSDDGSKLYLTDSNKLTTIDSSGNHLYTFTDPELSACVDGEGHVLVCDRYSGSILQISSDGKHKLGTMVNKSDKHNIRAICFDSHKSTLISAGLSDNVTVLQLK